MWIQISSGKGPDECELAVSLFLESFRKECNKNKVRVRAFHIPTGLTVTASEERSQYMNKKLALCSLSNTLKEKNAHNFSKHKKKMWEQHNTLERGNPFRMYEGKEFRLKLI